MKNRVLVHNASSPGVEDRLTRIANTLLDFFGDCERVDAYDWGDYGESLRIKKGTREISIMMGGGKRGGYGDHPFFFVNVRRVDGDADERCHAQKDGDCYWSLCPQLRDGEPQKSRRHCPLDRV